jgi:chromosome segregation protein
MTYIKKLAMKGFKSFARETIIDFDRYMNVVVGPNGSGKCLTGESLVQLSDGSIERIDNIVNSRLNMSVKTEDGFLIPGDGTEVFCLDMDKLKINKKPIKAFVKRTSPEKLLRIKTKSGREIKTTKYHPLFILKDNQVIAAKAEELEKGKRIAVPRNLFFETEDKYFTEILDLIIPEDNIHICHREEYSQILRYIKENMTWKELAKKIGVHPYVIKGILDKQSVNFAYLIKILRYSKFNDKEIINMINEMISKGSEERVKLNLINSSEFARFLGYLLSEGGIREKSLIHFTNGDEELIDDYVNLIMKLFNKKPVVKRYDYKNCWTVYFYSESLKKILIKFGVAYETEHKQISNIFLKHSSKKEISELLNGLYCGDGYVSDSSIEITTKSNKLAEGIINCLLRLGIVARKRKEIKKIRSINFMGIYNNIVIYGVSNFNIFNENIKLIHNKKRERLNKTLCKKNNPNTELIEINNLVKKISIEQGINIKKYKKEFPRIDSYAYNQCLPSRYGLQYLRNNLLLKTSESTILFDKLISSDIFWDEIIEIEEIKGVDWVYDLCVEKDHNFIANNIFVHNSNVTDALCFVLGRLSIKSIRAAKASHLIFSGNKQYKGANEAYVEIVFDNSDKAFSLDKQEIIIRRIVRKNGQSIYRINHETKTRQEVLELLAQAGIDPHGFNIILQGEIEKFVKMPSDERRKIIEEVAGISVYEMRKEKSLKELEKTDDRLKQINAILRERTNYLRNLENEREQALKFKKLEETVKKCKASIINRKIQEKEKELKEILDKSDSKRKEIEKKENQISRIQGEINNFNQEIENISRTIQQSSGLEQDSLISDISSLKQEIAGLTAKKENFENQLSELERRRSSLEDSIKSYEKEIEEIKKEKGKDTKKELEKKKTKLDEFEELKREYYNLKSFLSSLNSQIEDKKREIQRIRNESNFVLNQIEQTEKEIRINDASEKHNETLVYLKNSIAKSKEHAAKIEYEIIEKEKICAAQNHSIKESEEVKAQVAKLDICPLCKTKITKEHIDEVIKKSDLNIFYAKKIIEESENQIKKFKEELKELKEKIANQAIETNIREIDIVKIKNINEKKQQLIRNNEQIKIFDAELKNLENKKKLIDAKFSMIKISDEHYETLKLEVNEMQRSEERNLGIEITTKQRELERIKVAIKQNLRDKEEIIEESKNIEENLRQKQKIVEEKEKQSEILKKKYQKMFEHKNEIQDKVRFLESNLMNQQNEKRFSEGEINNLMIEKAQINGRKETLMQEFEEFKNVEVISMPVEKLTEKLNESEAILARIGSVNLRALEVYDEIKSEYDKIKDKVEQLEKEEEEILKVIEQIDRKKKKVFMQTLEKINELFSRNFSQLSVKGIVTLEPENEKEIFDGGLNIIVKVGGGKYFDVTSLSGGEQTLVALSLIFSIQEFRPYCFYIFDEIDAALDRRNSEKLAYLLKKHMKEGQYLIITHNDSIISESSNIIYGVSMQEGVSKILSLQI